MLGEVIGEAHGKRTGRRVIQSRSGGVRVEVSFEDTGKLLGVDISGIATYWSEVRPDGTIYGEGQGVGIGKDGDMATWRGMGVGKFTGGGAVSYRGMLSYYSTSPKLSRLNSVAAIFEFSVDASGNTHSKFWEWK